MAAMAQQASQAQSASAVAPGGLGRALGMLLRSYHREASEVMAGLPGGPRSFEVLSVIAGGSCQNQAAIAESLGIDRTVMTYLLDDLEARSLVSRAPDPADRRSRRVTLTAEGETLYRDLADQVEQVESRILADFAPAEVEQLRALLGRAALAVDPEAGSRSACDGAEAAGLTAPHPARAPR
jgi:DNA-binding MarR family transcriptional regulator